MAFLLNLISLDLFCTIMKKGQKNFLQKLSSFRIIDNNEEKVYNIK